MPALGLGLGLALANLSSRKFTQVAFVGDSITTYLRNSGSGSYQANGYGVTARVFCGGEFDFVENGSGFPYFALGGTKTSDHLSTYMPAAIAAAPDLIVYHGGINDTGTAAASAANVEAMIVLCRNAGIPLILTPVMGPPSGVNPTESSRVASLNTLIAGLATSYGLAFADWRSLTEASAGVSAVGILPDNTHPGVYGAWQMGSVLAASIYPRLKKTVISDYFANITAANFFGGNVDANPYFTAASATRPTGFSLSTASWGGSAPTESIIARTDGVTGNWWQVAASTATPETGTVTLQNTATRYIVGTAQAGAASTITLATSASASNSFYNFHWIWITSGTGAGQVRRITGYVGATRVATVDTAWATTPDATSVYSVGFRAGERVLAVCDLEVDAGADLRQAALRGFITTSSTIEISGDNYLIGSPSAYPMAQLTRKTTLRGATATVVPANSATSNSGGLRLILAGNFTVRISRFGFIGIDRTAGQLTFTP
jgi:hypothetical protein